MHPETEVNLMESNLSNWSDQLKRIGIANLAASLLQASRPLAPILAQLLYIADPLFPATKGSNSLSNLGASLEDSEQVNTLIQKLQSEAK